MQQRRGFQTCHIQTRLLVICYSRRSNPSLCLSRQVAERAIYTDTDSVIYVQKDDEPPLIDCGDRLGSMTIEFQPGEFIDEFVSGGPKNYEYRVVNRTDTAKAPKTVCKFRGINLNYSTSKLVNFDVIRDMILNRRPDEVLTVGTDKKFKRKRKEGRVQILSEAGDKIYRVSFSKRRRLHDNNRFLSVIFC